MAYRNKTFVSFDGADLGWYRLMTAWNANDHIDFDFHNAHDMQQARDSSLPATIRRSLRERLANTKQVLLLISDTTRLKAADRASFLSYEIDVVLGLQLPVICVNLNGSRDAQTHRQPASLGDLYRVSVPFKARAVQYALDTFPDHFASNMRAMNPRRGGDYYYEDSVYRSMGLS